MLFGTLGCGGAYESKDLQMCKSKSNTIINVGNQTEILGLGLAFFEN